MLSWRTKLEKLLCLKYFGSKSRANSAGRQTMKVDPSSFQEMSSSTPGSSTSWYVLVRNGVGIDLCESPDPGPGPGPAPESPVCSTGNGAMGLGFGSEP